MNTLLKKEIENAQEMIDKDTLKTFIGVCCYDEVGTRRDGTKTTLLDEMKTLGKWYTKIETITIYNYESRKAMLIVEYSEEERANAIIKTYELSAKKILWLSSQCKKFTGHSFVNAKVDMSKESEIINLVDALNFTMNHPDLV
mgnify:CR=1 FL=1